MRDGEFSDLFEERWKVWLPQQTNRPRSDEEDEEEPLDDSVEEDLRNPSVKDEEEDSPPPKPAAMLSWAAERVASNAAG